MNKVNYTIENKSIIMNGKKVDLPYEIVDVVNYQSLIIVRIEPAIGNIFNKNIYAFAENGDVKWQIEESPHGTQEDKPYTSLTIDKENKIIAGNWNGVDYSVSDVDGRVTPISFNK